MLIQTFDLLKRKLAPLRVTFAPILGFFYTLFRLFQAWSPYGTDGRTGRTRDAAY